MGIYEGFKDAVSLAQKIDNIELYRKILDLQAEAQKLSADMLEKDRAIHERDQEIRRLQDALQVKATLIRHGDSHFGMDSNGKPTGDPYCSHCFETKHIAIHIHQDPTLRQTSVCPACKNRIHLQRRIVDA